MFIKKIHESKEDQFAHVENSCPAVNWVLFRETRTFFCYFVEMFGNLVSGFEIEVLALLIKAFFRGQGCFCKFSRVLKKHN